MQNITKTISVLMTGCVLMSALYSCKNNEASNSQKCADSTITTVTTVTDTISGNATAAKDLNGNNYSTNEKHRRLKPGNGRKYVGLPEEPGAENTLEVTSPAFANLGVIPIQYTCDGKGFTPPMNVADIPSGTQSLTMIIHDYNANPDGGFTYWIIWNLDTLGAIPENFRNDYESMNAAKEYGNTPICSKSGNHKYHFIVYAVDCKLVMPKTTTKQSIERAMTGHVLAKGETIGIYNKQLQ